MFSFLNFSLDFLLSMSQDEEKTYEALHMRLTRPDVEGTSDLFLIPKDNSAVGLHYTQLPCSTPIILDFPVDREIASLHPRGKVDITEEQLRTIVGNGYNLDTQEIQAAEAFDGSKESSLKILLNPFA